VGSLADTLTGMVSAVAAQVFGETVSITRGATSTAGVTASWIRNATETQDQYAETLVAKITRRNWLVVKAAYTISGAAVTPQQGDRITDAAGNVWEIAHDGTTPAVRTYEDPNYWDVATKQVT
jgi:hypothetical protein